MFQSDQQEPVTVAAGGTLALDAAQEERAPSRLAELRQRISEFDWTPDLAEAIGSRTWLRGVATLGVLGTLAFAFWPAFELKASPSMLADQPVRDEYRSQMIMPLGLGGDSGRRMAAGSLVRAANGAPERSHVQLTAVLAEGDSFARMLQRAGASSQDAARASGLVAASVPLGEISPGTRVTIILGQRTAVDAPRQLEQVDFRARFDLAVSLKRNGADLALASRPLPVDTTPLRIRGIVGASLYRSARSAGVPVKAIQQYLQALDSHLSLEGDVQPGDSFDIVLAYKRAPSGEAQVGDVLYAGLNRGTKPVAELLRWGSDGQYLASSGLTRAVVETRTTGMVWPATGPITSGYGFRGHPVLGISRLHAGVDIGAPWGSPIRAAASGTVSIAGPRGGFGNYVRLEHGSGFGTGYGHMSRIAVAAGTHVDAGQIIGYVGSTGLSTGPHLHFENYVSGRTVNPLGNRFATVSSTVQQVDPKQIAAFKARLNQLKAIRPGSGFGTVAMARTGTVSLR